MGTRVIIRTQKPGTSLKWDPLGGVGKGVEGGGERLILEWLQEQFGWRDGGGEREVEWGRVEGESGRGGWSGD